MRTLALDLGTKTGFAFSGVDSFQAGTKLLATTKQLQAAKKERLDRRGDIRVAAFWEWLTQLHREHRFELVLFEDVQFSSSTMQTQLWSSLRAVVWLAFPKPVIVEAVPVGTLKKFATGSGSADKALMASCLRDRFVQFFDPSWDDNTVDAVWLYLWARQNLSRITKPL